MSNRAADDFIVIRARLVELRKEQDALLQAPCLHDWQPVHGTALLICANCKAERTDYGGCG